MQARFRPREGLPVTELAELERRLWAAADALRANSSLTPAEYRGPVLGLIFLAFAEHRFDEIRPELELKATERRPVSADDFRARGVLFEPETARLSWLKRGQRRTGVRQRLVELLRVGRPQPWVDRVPGVDPLGTTTSWLITVGVR